MNYLIPFVVLDLFNPFGLDSFVIPKVFALSLIISWNEEDYAFTETIAFLSAALIIVLFSHDWSTSILGCELMGFYGLIQIFLYLRLYKLSQTTVIDTQSIFLCLIPMLTYTILQRLGFDYSHTTWSIPYHRAVGTQGNPVFNSMVIGMLVPLVWSWFRMTKYWVSFCILCLMTAALWACGSKTGWLASGIGILTYECL